MAFLFDENLPRSLKRAVAKEFPDVAHVADFDLLSSADSDIWAKAKALGFAIVSKDQDFFNRAIVEDDGVKVVWIRVGNCSSQVLTELLLSAAPALRAFLSDDTVKLFVLPPGVSI